MTKTKGYSLLTELYPISTRTDVEICLKNKNLIEDYLKMVNATISYKRYCMTSYRDILRPLTELSLKTYITEQPSNGIYRVFCAKRRNGYISTMCYIRKDNNKFYLVSSALIYVLSNFPIVSYEVNSTQKETV